MWTWECGSIRHRADTASDWCHATMLHTNPKFHSLQFQNIKHKDSQIHWFCTNMQWGTTMTSYSPNIPCLFVCLLCVSVCICLFVAFAWQCGMSKKHLRIVEPLRLYSPVVAAAAPLSAPLSYALPMPYFSLFFLWNNILFTHSQVQKCCCAHTWYLWFFYTNTFWGLKMLHLKVGKFTTKKASQQNSVNYTLCVRLHTVCKITHTVWS